MESSSTEQAKALTRALFQRLAALEEGTSDYQAVRNRLVECNMTLVHFAARDFRNRSEPAEDIVQVGTIGLIKAVNRFDAAREVAFPTFALPTIRGEIKRFLRDTSWDVKVPRRLQELRIVLSGAIDHFDQEHNRSPTVPELAARLELPPDEIIQGLLAVNGYSSWSLDYTAHDEGEESASLAERFGEPDAGLEKVEYVTVLAPVIAALPERERTILHLRFGRDELTQKQIGDRLGMSQMHVSRLLRRTLDHLRAELTGDG